MSEIGDRPRVLFVWSQEAGHRSNFERVRPHIESHPDIAATMVPIDSWNPEGLPERFGLGPIAARVRPSLTVRALLRSRRWDAVYVISRGVRGNLDRLRRVPTVYSFDATAEQYAAMDDYEGGRFGRWVHRRHLVAATRLEPWSTWAGQGAKAWGVPASRITVNSPGVDLDVWHPPSEPPRADDDVRRVVFVGGDFERKGGHDLLEWFRGRSGTDIELHLVTPAAIESEPGVHVHRLSAADPAMHELVRNAHVSVLPSRSECFGFASVEALASGVPVVQSTVGGSADIVRPGETGALVSPGSPHDLGAAIEALLDDPDRYAAMRLAARAHAEARFDVIGSVNRTVALLLEAIDAHRDVGPARRRRR